jgi:hypothetical protein
MSATHATGVIELYELQSILRERSHRKAVQRAVEVIARLVPSCNVTLMTIGLRGQLRIEAWTNIATSIIRSAERSFNREGLPKNLADLIHTKKPAIIEDLSLYADWREPVSKRLRGLDSPSFSMGASSPSSTSGPSSSASPLT